MGQSGKAAFPHLHFSVRKDGKVIDPFDPDGVTTCATPGDSNLWQDRPEYRPGGLINAGFAQAIPKFDDIKAGTVDLQTLPADAPALVIWGLSVWQPAGRRDETLYHWPSRAGDRG